MYLRKLIEGLLPAAPAPAAHAATVSHPHLDDILMEAGGITGHPLSIASRAIAAGSLLAMDMALAAGWEGGSITPADAADYRARLTAILTGKGYRAEGETSISAALAQMMQGAALTDDVVVGLSRASGGSEAPVPRHP